MRRRELVLITITVIVLSCLALAGPGKPVRDRNLYKQYETFARIVHNIRTKYVKKVDADKLFEGAFKGMLQSLDPYSAYLPPEEKENLEVETQGKFGGLGIEITLDENGVLMVITPLEGTPAFRAGVRAGDRIVKIEGQSTKGITTREAVKKLRGPKGKPVTITVLHEDGTMEDIRIVRDIIKLKSVKDPHFVDEKSKIGYVRLSQFQKNSAASLDRAVRDLRAKGMRALVLDLRFNPGGLLIAAIEVADRFLSDGLIVSTKGRTGPARRIHASADNTYPDFPLAVLVSRRSASASEIVAGAIQDHKRGVLVGMRTFGKGSVQTLIPLEDGKSALRLTTAYYYTPSGRLIHRDFRDPNQKTWGIDPDIEVKVTPKEEYALWKYWHDQYVRRVRERNGQAKPDNGARKNNGGKNPTSETSRPSGDQAPPSQEVHDKTLEAAINALKGMLIARERSATKATR